MSEHSQKSITQLEERLEELSRDLGGMKRRLQRCDRHLEIMAHIGQILSSAPEIEPLSKQIVKTIKAHFGLHHVGLFLLDPSERWIVLNQAAGRASRTRMKEGYRLAIDEPVAVSWVCQKKKPYSSYPSNFIEPPKKDNASTFSNGLVPKAQSELAFPLLAHKRLVGVLDLQSVAEAPFDDEELQLIQTLVSHIGPAIEQAQLLHKARTDQHRASLLREVTATLNANLDFESIATIAVNLSEQFGASSGQINLLADTGEIYFKSSIPERNQLDDLQRKALVRRTVAEGLDAQVLKTGEVALVLDTKTDDRWLPVEHPDQTVATRSAICAPLNIDHGRLIGAISFVHPNPNHFNEEDRALLIDLAAQIEIALKNTAELTDMQSSLKETHLMLDISRQLAGARNFKEVYEAFVQGIMNTGVDRCVLYMTDEFDANNIPKFCQIVYVSDVEPKLENKGVDHRFTLTDFPILVELALRQETVLIGDIENDERLTHSERQFLQEDGSRSLIINPLVARGNVVSMISIEYRSSHNFNERELAMYRALCNQATLAIENARQVERTEMALAETQSLYRAGRVLAGAADLQEILEEALIEFLYSLGLDQGGITLITADRKYGQLMAYVENGLLQDVEQLSFPIAENVVYQQLLLEGQPLVSYDVANDQRFKEFRSFNPDQYPKSLLEAPMIYQGETIGWIGADAVKEHRVFNQREIDLARAMADQIAITIKNRRLLEQTQRHAEQLEAVATVGQQVSHLIDLSELLDNTVNLIRDRFGFYHVSIFLVDNAEEFAVVRASTGEVGKVMVERPHRLRVGGQSIVGFATGSGQSRIALDVGRDDVHFKNELLPSTRAEMALPLIARGQVIGALDVQSVEADAFSNDDVDTLQIMADQLAAAIENARLFEEIQRRLMEQAALYNIGAKLGATLDLQEATDGLVVETANALNVGKCSLTLFEDQQNAFVISDYARANSGADSNQGRRFPIAKTSMFSRILATEQEFIYHADDLTNGGHPEDINDRELEYLTTHNITALATVPVMRRNEIIGFLAVSDKTPNRRFNQADIALLDAIALQAANTIENARLYTNAQESQAFMKAIIDEIPDPIFIKDKDHKWVIVNKALCDMLGVTEEQMIGNTDYKYSPKEEADWFWEQDRKVFETGQIQEVEETHTNIEGYQRTLYTRKIPLLLSTHDNGPNYLVGIIQDITQRKQRELERELLIEETARALERTQFLNRISTAMATATDRKPTFETVLRNYLQILNVKDGNLMLLDKTGECYEVHASVVEGQLVASDHIIPIEDDPVVQHLLKNPRPLIIDDVRSHRLTKDNEEIYSSPIKTMLFVPLVMRGKLVGMMVAESTEDGFSFTQNDMEIGGVIADQLTIWLENWQLLEETRYRSTLLQAASEVSKQASLTLESDQLINTSVNFIRDQFDFYYVGMFMVDRARKWAVLRAGTGEAGRVQLEKDHRLEIGGESMIGWCIQNRQARIALDVGKDPVQFKNPYLPDTRSELALPLISRDEVIGALTVQSIEEGAFTDEHIVVLQTMADQLANAITNARLFAQMQTVLAETESLYKVTQELLSADDEESVYKVALETIALSDVDSCVIFRHVGNDETAQVVEQRLSWTAAGMPAFPDGIRFKTSDIVIDQFLPRFEPLHIEEIETDERLTEQGRQMLTSAGLRSMLSLPLSTYQDRLGFVIVAYKTEQKSFSRQQIRYFSTITQQMVAALANLRLIDASQRRARREEIIREITAKIRGSITVDDVLQTTVTELSKVLGASDGGITLNIAPAMKKQKEDSTNGDSAASKS